MNEPHDQNPTVDFSRLPPDPLDAGLAAGFGQPVSGASGFLAKLRSSFGDV